MSSEISFRHNVMTIQSLDTFINIRGGYSLGRKDVYFVRAIGECPDFLKTFENIDSRLADAERKNRIKYLRLKSLPNVVEKQSLEFYISTYSEWKQGRETKTRIQSSSKTFEKVLVNATKETVERYKTIRSNLSDSMIRNFVVKLWYWMDLFLEEVIKDWSEQMCVKILSDNIVKPQEYLFCYFATLLGCDVLILNNRADIDKNDNVRCLSSEITLGEFGTVELPEHKKIIESTHEKATKNPQKQTVQRAEGVRPQKQGRHPVKEPPQTIVGNSIPNNESDNRSITSKKNHQQPEKATAPVPGNTRNTREHLSKELRQEKTFEELAQLASSIVMIAVHDRKGDPVATGSGIMIGKKGFILTNCHVVKGGIIFAVRIEDDEKVYVTSEVIKYNPQLDLAVLRIDRELKPLPLYDGRKKLVRGQRVVAIGSPLGLFNSVSDGIISGFRKIKDVDMIQFTAPISHGSSGGAVLNMYGEIIGISTAGIDSGQNINLAVDYKDIRFFANGFF